MTCSPAPANRARRPLVAALISVASLLTSMLVLGATASSAGSATTATAAPAGASTARAAGVPKRFPRARNTGVPRGTDLRRYRGPCTIQSNRTLSGVDATRCDALLIQAPRVLIENSLVPRVESTDEVRRSVRIVRSDVRAGRWSDGALWGHDITAIRVHVTGGQHSYHCMDRCVVKHSYLHKQWNPDSESFHTNAFITNGGSRMVVKHNRLHCDSRLNDNDGGCTANVSLFGDFAPVSHVRVTRNLFVANNSSISYCAYGGHQPGKAHPVATHVVYRDNVFERGRNGRCGVYGPVTSFQRNAQGNQWVNNRWRGGRPVRP